MPLSWTATDLCPNSLKVLTRSTKDRSPVSPEWTEASAACSNRGRELEDESPMHHGNRSGLPPPLLRVQLPDRPYFNASLARRRNLRGHLDRVIQVPRLDQVKARQLLLRLD